MTTPTKDNNETILLAHGGGGRLSDDLIRKHILPNLTDDPLAKLADSARIDIHSTSLCFTTDSYVVKPLFFNGGDIGKLAVCGTVNDLAVAGARPIALSLALIIEEGLPIHLLDRIMKSIGDTARQSNVAIVTGDTKTVEAGAADQIFINTAGIGVRLPNADLGFDRIAPGDCILISGTIGDHGMTIMSQRKDIRFKSQLKSDCAALADLTCKIITEVQGVKFMRDPTRGGLAATLNEIAAATRCGVEIAEADLPINPTVRAAADILGFDCLNIANEGKFVAVVSPQTANDCVEICRNHPLGDRAALIGRITDPTDNPFVEMITTIGGRRIVQMPDGRELPRIC